MFYILVEKFIKQKEEKMNIQPTNMTFNAHIQVEGGFSKLVNTFVSASNKLPYKRNMSCGDFCMEIHKMLPNDKDIVKFNTIQDNPNDLACAFKGEIITKGKTYRFDLYSSYLGGTAPMGNKILKFFKGLIDFPKK